MEQMTMKEALACPTPVLAQTVRSRAAELKAIRKDVTKTTQHAGCGVEDVQDLMLAVDEACQNIIRYAYGDAREGDITLKIHYEDRKFIVMLHDFAETIDVELVKPRDLDDIRLGGLGTRFIAEIMDRVEFMPPPSDGGNLLRMVNRIS